MTEDPYRHLMQDYDDVLKSGVEHGPGWIPLLRRMLDEMIGALKAAGFQRSDLRIMQIKEKRGTLRCYYRAPLDLEHIVDKYEDKSAVICEQCGGIGQMRTGMYITCICDSCARKYKVEETSGGRLVRIGDYLRKLAPQPSFVPDRDSEAEADARLEEALRLAHECSNEPMSTPESVKRGKEMIEEWRLASIATLHRRIEEGELISAADLQKRLNVSAESINSAVQDRRLFACADAAGVNYYPAFYADAQHDREQIERVAQQLADLPATVKFHFFTSAKFTLQGKTPLEALRAGRVEDVLRAATEYVLR